MILGARCEASGSIGFVLDLDWFDRLDPWRRLTAPWRALERRVIRWLGVLVPGLYGGGAGVRRA